jgi:hypothetical protein
MRALDQVELPPRVAAFTEAVMTAAAALAAPTAPDALALAPAGVPVRSGRLSLGRVRQWLPVDGVVSVLAGFGTACWLGSPDERAPDLGRLVCRPAARADRQSRVVLDRRVRAWLGVADPTVFTAVLMPLATGGVLVVPVEGFAQRVEVVTS